MSLSWCYEENTTVAEDNAKIRLVDPVFIANLVLYGIGYENDLPLA